MYSKYLSINKNFQSSVNLELDLGKESKIDEYIPTSDICDVLKKYVKTALGLSKDKATTLIGPYGKGKSFLLLILTYLLGKNKETECWENLVKKIDSIDHELFELLQMIREKSINLLPVIINSSYDNITQAFQIAINDTLRQESINDIIPNSAYNICINLLDKWMSNETIKDELIKKCLKINKIDMFELRKGLKSFSQEAYTQFESLYNCVNIGLDFNPLASNDVIKTYSDVSSKLNEYGYDGIFIIFDEFSKFLESTSANIMLDLKVVQDMAELANRSTLKSQIHFCCVAHKSLSLYKPNKKETSSIDSFKTVEGRFKEIRFNRSLEENYQLISSAIIKSKDADKEIKAYLSKNKSFFDRILNLPIFNNEFLEKNLFYGCFPLNPITIYSIIRISEYVAQNERTLFTFISDTDDDSFNSFLHSSEKGLFNVDKIYDYFSNVFQKEETNSIRNIWYRAESILSKLENQNERKVIKVLSIILMINEFDVLMPTEELISLSIELNISETIKIVNSLIERHFLRKNILNNLLSFALSNTKQIDDAIEFYKKTKFKTVNYNEIADQINDKKYILPRKYNEENKIKRFYKIHFLSEENFNSIKSFDFYFENNYCDGLVIYLLKSNQNELKIQKKIQELNDPRIIVKCPSKTIDNAFYQYLLMYACLNEIEKQKELDEIGKSEIELLIEETKEDTRSLINDYFETSTTYYSCIKKSKEPFNVLLSRTMAELFPIKLIINNELINKKNITTQYQKAINHVIDWILDGMGEFNYSNTSPERSIRVSIIDDNCTPESISALYFRNIIDDLKNKIISNCGKKISVIELISYLSKPPYGIRTGVLPVILAKAISEISDNIVLYFQSKEIELESSNLVKAITNEKYQLSFSKGSNDQRIFLDKMVNLFAIKSENSFRKDVFILANAINKFFIGLPQVIRLSNDNNNFLNLDTKFIKYKSIFLTYNINPYETIFETPKKIFDSNDYNIIFCEIEKIKTNVKKLIIPFKNHLVVELKNIFNFSESSSLKSEFDDFISHNIKSGTKPILESTQKEILNTITINLTYDDLDCIDKLSKACVGQYIEDWNSNKTKELLEQLKLFKEAIENSHDAQYIQNDLTNLISNNINLSNMANLLKNNVESILDEFSESVSTSEKIAVLEKILKDLL